MLARLLLDVVGVGDDLLGADLEARLLERLALDAREDVLAEVEVAAGQLVLAWAAWKIPVSFKVKSYRQFGMACECRTQE